MRGSLCFACQCAAQQSLHRTRKHRICGFVQGRHLAPVSLSLGRCNKYARRWGKTPRGGTLENDDDKTMTIRRIVQKVAIGEQPSNFAYWQTQPYQARLAALEQIRQEYHRWHPGSESRLRRVYQVVKR